MKQSLYKIVNETNTKSGVIFNWTVQGLIFISVITLSLETVPALTFYKSDFKIIENTLLILFVIEYLLRLFVAKKTMKFIFSFYGMIDLLSIAPSLVTLGIIDLRFMRSLRFLRVIRILKLARYTQAMDRLKKAFMDIKEELIVFFILTCIILYISAAGIYFFEHEVQPENFKSIFHSLWWGVTTLTTVGYGDVYPITVGGRIFTFFILIAGLGIVSVPSALLASAFTKKD